MIEDSYIIIVEDDVDDQAILKDIFEELKIPNELICFDNCEQAFNFLMSTKTKPFLILCDINLPGMNGIQFKQKIDHTDYLRKKSIPFVFLSTAGTQQLVNEAYQKTSIQGYFQKPAGFQLMKERVQLIFQFWKAALQPQ